MSSSYFEELGDIYSGNITPKTKQQLIEEGESVGKLPEDSFPKGDKPMPTDKVWSQSGPESAEGFKDAENDPNNDHKEPSAYGEERLSQPVKSKKKDVKKESNDINNSTMKEKSFNKSSFDKLFEDVMGDDFEDDVNLGDDLGGDDLGDDLGDDDLGGDTISVDLPRDVAEQLHSALGDLLNGGDEGDIDDIEDIDDGGDDLGDDFEVPESHVELNAAPDSVSKLTGSNNKVALSPDGGGADSSAGGQEDGGKPKAAADGKGKLQGKSNKVSDLKGNAFSK